MCDFVCVYSVSQIEDDDDDDDDDEDDDVNLDADDNVEDGHQ